MYAGLGARSQGGSVLQELRALAAEALCPPHHREPPQQRGACTSDPQGRPRKGAGA